MEYGWHVIIPLITSNDYTERLVGEYLELNKRIGKLVAHIDSLRYPYHVSPDVVPIEVLKGQLIYMERYRSILIKRIKHEIGEFEDFDDAIMIYVKERVHEQNK